MLKIHTTMGFAGELATGMLERGDPRGIRPLAAQKAADSLSPEELEREQALKRTYAWDWLGPLADVVDVENSVFEKGYPVKLTVWTPNTRALRDVIGRPEWATVREIRWGAIRCGKRRRRIGAGESPGDEVATSGDDEDDRRIGELEGAAARGVGAIGAFVGERGQSRLRIDAGVRVKPT
ncbi:MAG: hypothetical protein R3F14_45230 [Polyangiaceae bacterium]